ncbi:MAG: peptide-methionine (S)-S-oxide reductase [Cyclobacteriaceae bacterium]
MVTEKIGFGGGCHWCTEAVFASLKGVNKVEQGWISSEPPNEVLSEAVLVHFNPSIISLSILIEIHLLTHASASNHSMRDKYRSAVYSFSDNDEKAMRSLETLSERFDSPLMTRVLPFVSFESSPEKYQDYYQKNQGKPFCETHINPKLQLLMQEFRSHVKA